MSYKRIGPYGSWESPITSDVITSDSISIGEIHLDDQDTYWTEMRPEEGGRYVIIKRDKNGITTNLTPPEFNVRTRVHEYGGGSFCVSQGTLYFSNFDDQRIYCQQSDSSPTPITPEIGMRYADSILDDLNQRLICIREDHSSTWQEPINSIVSLNLKNGSSRVIVSGYNFYAAPCLSQDGSKLAWLAWNHPNMPWDGTQLWVGSFNDNGDITNPQIIAGGINESILQPRWSPDGILYFISDKTGWWNIYKWMGKYAEALYPMEAEFGMPPWMLGTNTYGFDSPNNIVCAYTQKGSWYIANLDTDSGKLSAIETSYTALGRAGMEVGKGRAVLSAGSPLEEVSLIQIDSKSGKPHNLRRSREFSMDKGYLSEPEMITFPTENNLMAHGFYYPPNNHDYEGLPEEKPPLLVISHGGPTGATSNSLDLSVQFWTSRGIGILDVNYGGSTGYGKAYRQRLNGQWGIVDVADCINGAKYLINNNKADPNKLMIRGGSAGGYTTLAALVFHDVFKAGASYYGISDLEAMATETHKFESRYLDTLIAPYPERQDIYHDRSPIHFTDKLSCPVIMFQGLEDKIVPPNQAEKMLESLRENGLPVAYIAFEEEQHGFRKAENIRTALDAELYFYSRVFGFDVAGKVEKVTIENLL